VSEEQKDENLPEHEDNLAKDKSSIIKSDSSNLSSSVDTPKDIIKQRIGNLASKEKSIDKLSKYYFQMTMIDEFTKENDYKRESNSRDYWLKFISVVVCIGIGGALLVTGNQFGVMIIALGLGSGLGIPTNEIVESFRAFQGIESKDKGEKNDN